MIFLQEHQEMWVLGTLLRASVRAILCSQPLPSLPTYLFILKCYLPVRHVCGLGAHGGQMDPLELEVGSAV